MNWVLNSCITVINEIGGGFCNFTGNMFIQSSVLILLLLIFDFLIKKRVRATFRYWIWMLVFIKLILPPTLSLPTGVGNWAGDYFTAGTPAAEQQFDIEHNEPVIISSTPQFTEPVETPIAQINSDFHEPASSVTPDIPVTSAGENLNALTWQGTVFISWLVGVLVIAVLLVQRVFFVRGLIAQSEPSKSWLVDVLDKCCEQVGIRRDIQLKLSHNVTSPAVCGLFRPVILVPKTIIEKLSQDKLKAVLIHELAHIKRGDLWINCAQTFLQIAYFYNPFVWLANTMVRRIREQAVDEMVLVTLGTQADSYSNTLIDIAEMAFSRPVLSLRLVGVVESKKALSRRIKHILGRPLPKSAKLGIVGLLAIIVSAMVLLPMAKANKPNVKTDVQIENTNNTEDSISQPDQSEKVIGIIKEVGDYTGEITAEHGDAVYGNNIRYTPSLYLGRVRNDTKVQLINPNVIENQYKIPIIKIKTISECPGLPTGTIGWIKLKNTSFKDNFIAHENITLDTGGQKKAKIILRTNVFSIHAPISIITDYLRDELGVNNTTSEMTEAQAGRFRKWVATVPETTMISSPSILVFDGETANMSIIKNQDAYPADYENDPDSSQKPEQQILTTGVEIEFTPTLKKDDNLILINMNLTNSETDEVEKKTAKSDNQTQFPAIQRTEMSFMVAVPIGQYFLFSAGGMFSNIQSNQPEKHTILLIKADVQENAELSSNRIPAEMVGTWFFDNPMGDEEQMAIFPDGRIVVLYSNGHKDQSSYENGFIELAEYDNARFKINILENGTLIQYPDTETGGLAKRWRRIDSQPHTKLLRPLTGEDNNKTDVRTEMSLERIDDPGTDSIIKEMETVTNTMVQAFNAGDIDKLLSFYTDDGIRLPDQTKAAIGKDALRELQMRELRENVKIQSFKELDKRIYVCGDYVLETGKVVISFSKENMRYLLSDWINYVTIWNKGPDGSLKIKLDATSPAVIPEGGNIPEADGFLMVKVKSDSGPSEDMNAVYEKIKKYENEFHQKFIERDTNGAAGFYAEDAILMPWRQNAVKGKKEITEFIKKDIAESPLVDMTVDVAHTEGNNNIIYAANIFTWTFKDSSSGQDVTFPGKGVHVWSRQEDGSWKILLDLNNVSVPIPTN